MTMADAEKMLEWKNYPETRQFTIQSHDEIKLEDHLKWLENNVQYFQIIQFNPNGDFLKPLMGGAVRIHADEISIWIDRAFRNQGIATRVIEMVAQKGMTAKIVDGNVGSLRAFIKAGFLPVEYNYVDTYYLMKL